MSNWPDIYTKAESSFWYHPSRSPLRYLVASWLHSTLYLVRSSGSPWLEEAYILGMNFLSCLQISLVSSTNHLTLFDLLTWILCYNTPSDHKIHFAAKEAYLIMQSSSPVCTRSCWPDTWWRAFWKCSWSSSLDRMLCHIPFSRMY